jgi:hypothetical protein
MNRIETKQEIEISLLTQIASEIKADKKFIYLPTERECEYKINVLIISNDKRFGFSKTGFWVQYTIKEGLWSKKSNVHKNFFSPETIKKIISGDKHKGVDKSNFETSDFNILCALYHIYTEYFNKINDYRIEILNKTEIKQKENSQKLKQSKTKIIQELDKDNNGDVDLIQNDFNRLLNKNQKNIIEVDKNYIHQFVKISNFIKTKKVNTQKIFESIRDTSSQEELEERVNLLKNQIHAYDLLVFHSINMIGALVSEDLISFYEIYESFDKLGMFNSNWENEVSEKLINIEDKLDDLMYSIYDMEQNIVNELSHLSYVTQDSFEDLNRSVTSQLKEVESSINTNNLLTGIQAYQLYKINKNTKSLRG